MGAGRGQQRERRRGSRVEWLESRRAADRRQRDRQTDRHSDTFWTDILEYCTDGEITFHSRLQLLLGKPELQLLDLYLLSSPARLGHRLCLRALYPQDLAHLTQPLCRTP